MPAEHALTWFEIPAANLPRAIQFYETVLGVSLVPMEVSPGYPMAMFPAEGVNGALITGEGYTPSADGSLIYLSYPGDLDIPAARVEPAGGKLLAPKTSIGSHGYILMFLDTEGNRVGLHSNG